MHINDAKEFILNEIKSAGFKPYNVRNRTGDFRIFPSDTHRRVQVMCLNGTNLKDHLLGIGQKIKSLIEGGCEVSHMDDRIFFSSKDWEVRQRKKRGNSTETSSPQFHSQTENDENEEGEKETEEISTSSTEDIHENFNTELKRLSVLGNRFETLLDEFRLNRMSARELFASVFDGLEKEGIKIYTTKVQIQVSGTTIVIPHITKESFIEIGIKVAKKKD